MSAVGLQTKIVQQFCLLNGEQKHDLILQLLQNVEHWQLQRLFYEMKQLLSFDIVSDLPEELADKVLSYLDAPSLCTAAQCCHRWRGMTNRDILWHRLCKQRNYLKFAELPSPDLIENKHPTSPRYKSPPLSPCWGSLPPLCKWKLVYTKAHTLVDHWRLGIYNMAPLLRGHRQPVTTISCDDELLVSGSGDNTARLWSLQSMQCLHVLEGHTDAVNQVVIKDSLIVTACSDSLVRVFDTRTGQCLMSLHGHTNSVEHVAFNGRTIVSGGCDCSVRVWDVHKGMLLHTLTGHTEEIEYLWLGDSVALSGSWDCTLRVWDLQAGICKHTLLGHTEVVFCCVCTGQRVVSGGGDGVVNVWDLETGNVTATLTGHTQEVVCLQCNDDILASGSADSTVRLWNYTGFCLHVLDAHIGVVRCLYLQGNLLISGGDRKRIILWDTKAGTQLYTVHRQQTLLHCLCVTDTKIITASPDSPGTISVISYW